MVRACEGLLMPIHDWTRVDAGLFHHFHQQWIGTLCAALNSGGLPPGYFALAEQVVSGPIPDVLTLHLPGNSPADATGGGIAVASQPPQTRFVHRAEIEVYARKADRITIRHRHGEVIAVVEIVSPGNKDTRNALRTFVDKATLLLRQGVHLLIVDLFPLSKRDPQGVHKAIWDEIRDEAFALPVGKPLTLAAYQGGPLHVAYVEPVAVGDALPDMPLFLEPEVYIPAPLEATYQAAWALFPVPLKGLLESGHANGHGLQ